MLKLLLILSINLFVVVHGGNSPNGVEIIASLGQRKLDVKVTEDALLDVPGLLTKYGYPVETHTVQTEDGYLVTLHRIPHGKNTTAGSRAPVLMMHGLLCSSADWVLMGPKDGLGYILADKGYDVWMANARGNHYSKNHITLSPKDAEFWEFDWNEIGMYDLPAMIDYILKNTGKEKLNYIGHSQGTTAFFVMGSERPEYNKKIQLMQALAPVAYGSHMKSPIVKLMAPYSKLIKIVTQLIGVKELLPNSKLMKILAQVACNENAISLPLCTNLLFLISGYDQEQLNVTMLPIIMAHTPAGSSVRQLVHYGQLHTSDMFRKYDFGRVGNLKHYNRLTPPHYNLKSVAAPVALHYSDNDWLVGVTDLERLNDELPNVVGKFRVSNPKFNHLDFLWAIDVQELLYNKVISLFNEYNK